MIFSARFLKGCACALAFSLTASAQVLMLDFGPTTPTLSNLTNSPYHTANESFTENDWNTLGVSDPTTGTLIWSTGDPATVSLNLGATPGADTTEIDLNIQPGTSNELGTAITAGVYSGNSVGKDGIYRGSSGQSRAVGAQIGGLVAGNYDIYITGRNTNISAAHVQNFYAGKSSAAGNFDFGAYGTPTTLSFGSTATSATATWIEGANYAKFSVTLTSGEFLNLAVIGGSGEARGFLNMIQIVNTSTIPESSTTALIAGLLGLGAVTLRRRRA